MPQQPQAYQDAEVQELLQALQLADDAEYQGVEQLAPRLLAIGQQRDDARLRGMAEFYLGAGCYANGQLAASTQHCTAALPDLESARAWDLLGRAYNLLGLMLYYQGDVLASLDSFWAGIELTKQYACSYVCAMLCQNLSTIFEDGADYESCLEYRLAAREYLTMAPHGNRYDDLHLLIETLMLRICLKLDRREEAARQAEMVRQLGALVPSSGKTLDFLVYLTQYEYRYGSKERAGELMAQTYQAMAHCDDILNYFDDCLDFALWQAQIGEYEGARTALATAAAGIAPDAEMSRHLQLQLQTCRIQCYELIGPAAREERIDALEQYYHLSQRNARAFNDPRSHLQLRARLEDSRREIKRLSKSAQTDSLTGMPNRRRLVEQQTRWFDEALKDGTAFAVGMVDVDDFKQMNDNYGHDAGDQCLQYVSAVLAEQSDDRQFVARYGGDEFMILYRGLSAEEIRRRAQALRAQVERETVSLGFGAVTVSQGVYNAVPTRKNRLWDFTTAADKALYRCKRQGRNAVLVCGPGDLPDTPAGEA